MRNLKKFLALVLAMMMVFSLMMTVNAANTDYSDSPYANAISILYNYGVVQGVDAAGNFNPNGQFTRAEMAGIAYRIATGDVENKYYQQNARYAAQMFTDVPENHWAAGYIGFCVNWGIVKGIGNDQYNPSGLVTGYEIAGLMLNLLGYGVNNEYAGTNWQKNIGEQAQKIGITTGLGTTGLGNTSLSKIATRAEVAEVAYQAAFNANCVNYVGGAYAATGVRLINTVSSTRTTDEWGAPATKYVSNFTWPEYTVTAENTIPDEPELEIWTPVSQASVYKAAGLTGTPGSITVYLNGKGNKGTQDVSATETSLASDKAMGGQGRWTRVFKDTIVYVDTFLGAVVEKMDAVIVNGVEAVSAYYSAGVYYNNVNVDPATSSGSNHKVPADNGFVSASRTILGKTTSFNAGDVVAAHGVAASTVTGGSPFSTTGQIGSLVDAAKVNATRVTIQAIVKDTADQPVGIRDTNNRVYLYNCAYTFDGANDTAARLTETAIGKVYYLYLDNTDDHNILGLYPDETDTVNTGVGVVLRANDAVTITKGSAYGAEIVVLTEENKEVTLRFFNGANTPYGSDTAAETAASGLVGKLVTWVPDTTAETNNRKGYSTITAAQAAVITGSPDADGNPDTYRLNRGDSDAISTTVSDGKLLNDDTVFFIARYTLSQSKGGYVFNGYQIVKGFKNIQDLLVLNKGNYQLVEENNPYIALGGSDTDGYGLTTAVGAGKTGIVAAAIDTYNTSTGAIVNDGSTYYSDYFADYALIINAVDQVADKNNEPVTNYAYVANPSQFKEAYDQWNQYKSTVNGTANQTLRVQAMISTLQVTGLYALDDRDGNNAYASVNLALDRTYSGTGYGYNAGVLYNTNDSNFEVVSGTTNQFYTISSSVAIYLIDPANGSTIRLNNVSLGLVHQAYSNAANKIWFQLDSYGFVNLIYVELADIGKPSVADTPFTSIEIGMSADPAVGMYRSDITFTATGTASGWTEDTAEDGSGTGNVVVNVTWLKLNDATGNYEPWNGQAFVKGMYRIQYTISVENYTTTIYGIGSGTTYSAEASGGDEKLPTDATQSTGKTTFISEIIDLTT